MTDHSAPTSSTGKKAGQQLQLIGWNVGAETISAMKCVQSHTDLSLREAKTLIENCISGEKPTFNAKSAETAAQLKILLLDTGFLVR